MKTVVKIFLAIFIIIIIGGISINWLVKSQCGDALCQKWEAKRSFCPKDCLKITTPITPEPIDAETETTETPLPPSTTPITPKTPEPTTPEPEPPAAPPAPTTINYQVRLKRGCEPDLDKPYYSLLQTKNYHFVIVNLTDQEKQSLAKDSCVTKITTAQEAKEKFSQLPVELQETVMAAIQKYDLAKSIRKKDLIDRQELLKILEKEQPSLPGGTISHYQLYVTPEDPQVKSLAQSLSNYQAIYEEAVSWTWVAEEVLNKTAEKWLKPAEFLKNTPSYPTNPVKGRIVSDCSEQANALASLLRTKGAPAGEVRVVLGQVDFDGEIGGHAWVQLWQDGLWVDLDPTSGPFWDDQAGKLISSEGIPWTYFKFFPFPVVETWVYYNDQYFYDLELGQGNAPAIWQK